VDAAAADSGTISVLAATMILIALGLVIGGAVYLWAWQHERRHRDEGPLLQPPPPEPPQPPATPSRRPPNAPLGP
jgi:hypothetical protein